MYRLSKHIAFFLLLLFVRVLLPETAVLALHNHEHTEEETNKGSRFAFEKMHHHCAVDKLYNAPFTPVSNIVITQPVLVFFDTYSENHACVWKFTFPNNTDLRGPPAV